METPPDIQEKLEPYAPPPERSRAWRIVAIVLMLHALLLGSVVLIQGCSRSNPDRMTENSSDPAAPHDPMSAKDELSPREHAVAATPAPGSDLLTPEEHLPAGDVAGLAPESILPGPSASDKPPAGAAKAASPDEIIAQERALAETQPAPAEPAAPAPKAAAATAHTVRKGESLYGLARKYGVTVRALAAASGISEKAPLRVGQKLSVPSGKGGGAAVAAAKAAPAPRNAAPKTVSVSRTNHTVRAGETVASIARRYGVSAEALMKANNIKDPRRVRVKQKLSIPAAKVANVPAAPARPPPPPEDLAPAAAEEPAKSGTEVKRI